MRQLARVAVFAMALAVFSAAQPAPPSDSRVDVAPLPAEDRDSIGAVVLGDAPVRAQTELMRARLRAQAVKDQEPAAAERDKAAREQPLKRPHDVTQPPNGN